MRRRCEADVKEMPRRWEACGTHMGAYGSSGEAPRRHQGGTKEAPRTHPKSKRHADGMQMLAPCRVHEMTRDDERTKHDGVRSDKREKVLMFERNLRLHEEEEQNERVKT